MKLSKPKLISKRKWVNRSKVAREICTGIYSIKCSTNGKQYLGSSSNARARMDEHRNNLREGNHSLPALQDDYNTYGGGSFTFKLIKKFKKKELADLSVQQRYNLVKNTLTELMIKYKSYAPFGYNVLRGRKLK